MDSMKAFAISQIAQSAGITTQNVFDWDKARRLIDEAGASEASAGLRDDWEWTGGLIWIDGAAPKDMITPYLKSVWAIPEIKIDGDVTECYYTVSKSSWGPGDLWPDTSGDIKVQED